jgi:hypothetical protein
MKSRLNSSKVSYHSVQNLLFYRSLPKNIKIITYKTINLPIISCGFEAFYLILREEHRLRVFENSVLKRIFGPKRDGIIWRWRKLYNAKIHNVRSSSDVTKTMKSKRVRWTGMLHAREKRDGYWNFWNEKLKERTTNKWEGNIKMCLKRKTTMWAVYVARNRDQWRVFGNTWMRLRSP